MWISRKRYYQLVEDREALRVINEHLSVELDLEREKADHYNRAAQAWYEGFDWMRGQVRFRDGKIRKALEKIYSVIAGNARTPTGCEYELGGGWSCYGNCGNRNHYRRSILRKK